MEKLRPAEKLDLVLRHFKEKENRGWLEKDDIFNSINGLTRLSPLRGEYPTKITSTDFLKAIAKLKKDGFIESMEYISKQGKDEQYKISFEGDSLLEIDRGYTGRLQAQNVNAQNEKYHRQVLLWFSVLAGIGTFGLLILEVIKVCYQKTDQILLVLFCVGILILYQLLKRGIMRIFP